MATAEMPSRSKLPPNACLRRHEGDHSLHTSTKMGVDLCDLKQSNTHTHTHKHTHTHTHTHSCCMLAPINNFTVDGAFIYHGTHLR